MLLRAPLKKAASISITPLIDVVFILLLFFMLSSTFQGEKQIEMNSSPLGGQTKEQKNMHKLLLDIDNKIFIDGVKYPLDSKEFEKHVVLFAKSNGQITLVANPEVKVQNFIQLVDCLTVNGITNLTISKTELP